MSGKGRKKMTKDNMDIDETNWDDIAKYILEQEKSLKYYNYPESTGIIVRWKSHVYIGSVQEIVPEFSKEIVLLSKSGYILPDDLINVIKKLDKERLELDADNSLDLIGRQHILRRLGNRLTYMTSEQTKYMIEHPVDIHEI